LCTAEKSDNKPSVLSFVYTSGAGTTISNNQEGKATVSGSVSGQTAVVTCSGVGFGPTPVAAGIPFAVTNVGGAGANLECSVSAGGSTQTIVIHVSCSKILSVGDQFGSLTITGFVLTNKKTNEVISSADPSTCPACELCCVMADLMVPNNVEIPAGSPGSNQDALHAWVASASCTERGTGNKLPTVHTLALLDGYDTCTVQSQVTWTCVDDCGNHYSETRTFKVVDRTPPVVIVPPKDLTIQCHPGQPNYVPTDQVGAWLTQTWLAEDETQNAAPCINSGSNIYISPPVYAPSQPVPAPPPYGSAPAPAQYGTTYSSGQTPPNGGYSSYRQSGYGAGNPYYKQSPKVDAASGRCEGHPAHLPTHPLHCARPLHSPTAFTCSPTIPPTHSLTHPTMQ
jgi:hypothetical protein